MAGYEVRVGARAIKQLEGLPREAQRRVAEALDGLAHEPRPRGGKHLAAAEDLWRIRVGVYRIVYAIEDERLLVLVVKVGHRRDVYRGL